MAGVKQSKGIERVQPAPDVWQLLENDSQIAAVNLVWLQGRTAQCIF